MVGGMSVLSPGIKRIMKKNERYAKLLEYYDRTGRLPLKKTRRNFTLKDINFQRLKKASKSSGKSMSRILDELVEKGLANL